MNYKRSLVELNFLNTRKCNGKQFCYNNLKDGYFIHLLAAMVSNKSCI